MKRWALITTSADLSKDLFLNSLQSNVDVYFYDTVASKIQSSYDVVYFRDPFNEGSFDLKFIKQAMSKVFEKNPDAYYFDGVRSTNELLIEDKWHQYKIFSDFMPYTEVLQSAEDVTGEMIAKKRISARARDIAFTPEKVKEIISDYILQKKMHITNEYRVYIVGGSVLPLMSRKSPLTLQSKVKVEAVLEIFPEILDVSLRIANKIPALDFIGLDIAQTDIGLQLIEVNRSPQFLKYSQMNGIDIVKSCVNYVNNKI